MTADLSLFGGNTDSGALAPLFSQSTSRQVRREVEQAHAQQQVSLARVALRHQVQQAELAASTALRAAEEHATSYLHASALSNTAALVAQAKSHAKTTPEGAALFEALVTGYVQGAINRLNRGM